MYKSLLPRFIDINNKYKISLNVKYLWDIFYFWNKEEWQNPRFQHIHVETWKYRMLHIMIFFCRILKTQFLTSNFNIFRTNFVLLFHLYRSNVQFYWKITFVCPKFLDLYAQGFCKVFYFQFCFFFLNYVRFFKCLY